MEDDKKPVIAEELYDSFMKSDDPSLCLATFISQAEDFNGKISDYDIVKHYLLISGNCKEILNLVKDISSQNSISVSLIMKTLCNILIRIASDLHVYIAVGLSIVNEILLHGTKNILGFLKHKQKPARTMLALHLLSSMVAIGGQTSELVVSKLDLRNVTFTHLYNRRNFDEEEDIRTSFINLIIIILTTSNFLIIRQLVEIKGFLIDVFYGLVSDKAETIISVLSTYRKVIVENALISKTTKLRMFNDKTLKPVIKLYNWRGPIRINNNRKRKLGLEKESVAYEVPQEEFEKVQKCAHEFMLSLFCVLKTGIIFHDSSCGTSGKNLNFTLLQILKYMPKPHTNKLARDFVVSALKTCPDQMIFYLPYFKVSCIPRSSATWAEAMIVIKMIIEAQDPIHHLFRFREKKPVSNLVNIAKSLCYPNVIEDSEIVKIFESGNLFQCYMLCDYLSAVLNQVKVITQHCTNGDFSKTPYSATDISSFRHSFLLVILKTVSYIEHVNKYWVKVTSESNTVYPKEDSKTTDSKRDLETVDSNKDLETVDSDKVLKTIHLDKRSKTVESEKDLKTNDMEENLKTIDSEEDWKTIDSEEDSKTVDSNKGLKTIDTKEGSKTVVSEESSKNVNPEGENLPCLPLASQLLKVLEVLQLYITLSHEGHYNYNLDLPFLFRHFKQCYSSLSPDEICSVNLKIVDIIAFQDEEAVSLWNMKETCSPIMVLLDVYLTSSAKKIEDVYHLLKKVNMLHTF